MVVPLGPQATSLEPLACIKAIDAKVQYIKWCSVNIFPYTLISRLLRICNIMPALCE